MDPETLVTFLFRAPPHIRTVELLGSWDNFTHTYRMHHDRRRGTGFWSGCFKFENIVFDGDTPKPNWSRPRTGGLKQGGTYWYYYRLDFEIEAYDDSRRCTADCPLMPGQMMNMIEVPTELLPPPSRSRSACGESIAGTLAAMTSMRPRQTLEPGDKFAALTPPPVSKVHGRCISDLALNGRLERQVVSKKSSIISPPASRDREEEEGDVFDDRPSKRRRSSDRKVSECTVSTRAAQSCRYGSIVDGYATASPLIEPVHPNPLASSPVNQDVREELQRGLSHFNLGFGEPAAATEQEKDERAGSPTSPRARRDSVSTYDSRGSSSARSTRSCPAQQQSWHSFHDALSSHEAGKANAMIPSPSSPHSNSNEPASDPGEEFWSPTFSADTVSSNGGLNTPFRLSGGYSPGDEGQAPAQVLMDENTKTMNDIAERLKKLDTSTNTHSTSDVDALAFPQPPRPSSPIHSDSNTFHSASDISPRSLHHAGLPSLGFNSSRKSATEAASGLTLSVTNTEDLFSELGYLSGCIN